jgi:hypothetical protein
MFCRSVYQSLFEHTCTSSYDTIQRTNTINTFINTFNTYTSAIVQLIIAEMQLTNQQRYIKTIDIGMAGGKNTNINTHTCSAETYSNALVLNFIYSFIHLFIYSFVHLFIYLLVLLYPLGVCFVCRCEICI